jgi:hypothetical protein
MAKLTISDFSSIGNETSFLTALNAAFTAIEAAMENTVSRDGTAPNDMSADLDLGDNDLLNVDNVDSTIGKVAVFTTAEREGLTGPANDGGAGLVYDSDTMSYWGWDRFNAVWKELAWA